jgi:nucleoid DNA-binding protein
MKLKELSDAIATACNVRANVVTAIQTETFKQIREAADKGERIVVPEFGIFIAKDVPGEDGAPATKGIRFRPKSGKKEGKGKGKGKGGGKKNKGDAKPENAPDDED